MKRKYMLLIISIIICSNLLSSCRNDELDLLIQDNTVKSETNKSKYDINYGPFTPETEYKPDSAYDDFNNIYPMNKTIRNGRYYFNTTKDISTPDVSTSAQMLTYTSLKTGTNHYICHDPLCEHNTVEECKYVNFWFGSFINSDNNTFYAVRWDYSGEMFRGESKEAVYRVDLNKDEAKKLFVCDYGRQFITFHNLYNGKIYCTNDMRYEITEDKKVIEVEKRFIYTMNPANDKFEEVVELSDEFIKEYESLIYVSDSKFYFISLNSIFVTDFSLNNKEVIYSLNKDESFGEYYYDENTKELYFCVYSQENEYGYIYRTKQDNSVEKLSMPSENICTFQLSEKNIYYSECDPINYGISARYGDRNVYDLTGGKIYRTSRDSRDTAELIYDEGDLYYFMSENKNPYTVIGDYLYFDYCEIKRSGEYVTPSLADTGFKIRIHLKDKTLGIIGFD